MLTKTPLNSSILERGLTLLNTLQNIPMDQKTENTGKMNELIDNHLTEVLPEFSAQLELTLPELKIPKLKKV